MAYITRKGSRMSKELINRYVWLVDTIRRYGRISRRELDACWRRSTFGDGRPMPRRTFYNYRMGVAQLLGLNIECDSKTYEYYISEDNPHDRSVTDWLLDSSAMSHVLTGARDVADRIFLEEVPSSRAFLGVVIDALRDNRRLRFDYQPYTRSRPTEGILFEPYLLKIFRQRWYVAGRNVAEGRLKTYALDRMTGCVETTDTFTPDAAFDAEAYFHDAFGIVVTEAEPHHIVLRTDPRQAKYFRALPLHHSQEEMVHDEFSDFHYRLRITDDFVSELLSYGSRIRVISPPELKARLCSEYAQALSQYDSPS